ncbi:hypothetical protein, partial [Flavobacterium sp. FlaQc-48]|uniref:Ig-like domain-containing protein n=1 Tax=Flavobacterium sp. FlaQc-48 TaxID=3374181 RepID=UPI0037577CF4
MKSKITLVLLLCMFILAGFGSLRAQAALDAAPASYQPATLVQGGAPGTFSVNVKNNSSTASLTGAVLKITLPAGMEYAGNIQNAIVKDVSVLNVPQFTVNSMAIGAANLVSFDVRIICGYIQSGAQLKYELYDASNVLLATVLNGPTAANTPAPAFVFTAVPSPLAVVASLNTNAAPRTLTFKNSGSQPVTTVYLESDVVNPAQYSYYKIVAVNQGIITAIPNTGYRVTLTGTALQNAITTGNGDASFDPDETITITLTEQILNCNSGSAIALNMKAGSGDIKGSFCFFDNASASISAITGNPSLLLTRLAGATLPDFCNSGKVSFTIGNSGSGGVESALHDIKIPWSTNNGVMSTVPSYYGTYSIKKVSINGNDVTAQVMTQNGIGSGALISGIANVDVINLAGLTSAYGSSLATLEADGKFDDLMPGQNVRLDVEYGYNPNTFASCTLNAGSTSGQGYFNVGYSYKDQCGTTSTKTDLISPGYVVPPLPAATGSISFYVGNGNSGTVVASLDTPALLAGGTTNLNLNYNSTFNGTYIVPGKVTRLFTIVLPDGLQYNAAGTIKYGTSATVVPSSAISYNTAAKTLTITLNTAVFTAATVGNDNFVIPVTGIDEAIVNMNVGAGASLYFNNCTGTVVDYSCQNPNLNYAIITNSCGSVGTTNFAVKRATFGFIPDVSGTNKFYRPTGFVDENTSDINLQGAVSKDRVKFTVTGKVNNVNYSELWARAQYTPVGVAANLSNFDPLSATGSDVAGVLTVSKAAGGTITANITVSDVVFSYVSANQVQVMQVNVGNKITAAGYTPVAGDILTVDWMVNVSKTNLSYVYTPLTGLQGDFYTKDAGGVASDCPAYPAAFAIQRLFQRADMISPVSGSTFAASPTVNFAFAVYSSLNQSGEANTIDHFPKEVRQYDNARQFILTLPGIWSQDVTIAPYLKNINISTNYTVPASQYTITYVGGNTVITVTNDAFDANGMPASTGFPAYDICGNNGYTSFNIAMKPACVVGGSINAPFSANYDSYTTGPNNNNKESFNRNTSITYNYVNYTANSAPTLSNVDGIGSTVSWQVQVVNTTNTAAMIAAGKSPNLPNNWMSFVSPNNNITVTKVINTVTHAEYPVLNYGAGKYWVQLGDIVATNTYDVVATYTACSNDILNYTYGFNATGYPVNPDLENNGTTITCAANQSTAVLNLFPKDASLTMGIVSPSGNVQFCNNPLQPGEVPIIYQMTVTNTATANAQNLVMEATFPDGYTAKTGTSKLTFNGSTKTLSDPVFNTGKGVWEWNITTDPNGIESLPGANTSTNTMIVEYQGLTSCGFVSGSAVKYHMSATNGCGQERDYTASGAAMLLSGIPASLNTYFLDMPNVALSNDGGVASYTVGVGNQGGTPTTAAEQVTITVPSGIDIVPGSITAVTNAGNITNATNPISNTVTGLTRTLVFQMPADAGGVSLGGGQTAAFKFDFTIVNASLLTCGNLTEAIDARTIFSVTGAMCDASACTISSITSEKKTDLVITKTNFTVNQITSATSVYNDTTSENVTINFNVKNTGTLNKGAEDIAVDFFSDTNGSGVYEIGETILFTKIVSGILLAGATSATQTANFVVPETSMCKLTAGIRRLSNTAICTDSFLPVNAITLESTPVAFTVCPNVSQVIGTTAITGATYNWSSASYLSSATVANPTFKYTGSILTVSTPFTYTLTVTRPDGCTTFIDYTITVDPTPTIIYTSGTVSPTICINTPITAITYTTGSGATGASATNLPAGVTGSFASGIFTISGTPTASGTFNYTVSTTGGCSVASLSGTITVNPATVIALSSDVSTTNQEICLGTPITAITYTTGSGATGVSATGLPAGVTGSFASDVFTISGTPTASGTFNYTVSTTGGCSVASLSGIITINPLPSVVINNPLAVCSGTTVDLTAPAVTAGSTAGLTYSYFTDALGTAVLSSPNAVAVSGTYYIKGSAGGCSDIEPVTVTINPLPTVVINDPAAVCSGTTVDLTASAVTAGSTAGLIYSYFTDALGTTVLSSPNAITVSGTYYIKGTAVGGCTDIKPVTVTINPLPTVVINNPAAVCSGTTVDLTASAVTAGSTSGLTYSYFTDALGTTVLSSPNAVTASGTYYIKGTTAAVCSDIQPVVVTVNPIPTVIINNPSAVCSGTTVDLTASAVTAGSTAGLIYSYFTDALGTTVLSSPNAVTVSGTYYIKGTAVGCSDIKPVTVTINPLPTVVINNPEAVCSGTTVDLTASAVTAGSTSGLTYSYFTDALGTTVLSSPNAVTASGTYYIKGTSAAVCSDIQPVVVTVNPIPTVIINNPSAVCSGTTVDLTASALTAGSTAGLTYSYFTDALGTAVLSSPNAVAVSGTYYIKGSAGGCSDIEPVTVTINPLPTVVINDPAAVCSGTTVDLTAPAVTAGSTTGLTYSYFTDALGTTLLSSPNAVAVSGTYYIKGTSTSSCTDIQPVMVTINPLPSVVINNPSAVCSGTTVDLTAPAVTAGSTTGLNYSYFTDALGTTVLSSPNAVTASGTYYIKGTSAAVCSDIQPVVVTITNTPTVVINNPAVVCSGTTVDLTVPAVTAGSTAGLTYSYFTDALGTTILSSPNAVTVSGTYYIKGTAVGGCSDIQPVAVTINPVPTVVINNPAAVCSGTTVDLTVPAVTAGSTSGLTYSYFTDALGTTVLSSPNAVTASGTYYIKGTSAAVCSDIQPVVVTITNTPTVVINNPAVVCSGTTVDLTAPAVTAGSTAGLTYSYFTDALGTTVLSSPNAVTVSGTYYIKGTAVGGCSDIQPVTVTINPAPSVVINNPAAVCSGTTVDLTAPAVTAGSTAGLTYSYFTDALGTTVLSSPNAVTASGTYYIKGTSAAVCSDIQPVMVTINPLPSVVINNPSAVCSGTTVDLTVPAVTAGSTAGLTYSYFTDALGTTVLSSPNAVTASGTYYIKGTSAA